MAVPQCMCVCVCVWRNDHKWKFFTCSATVAAVVVFAVVIGSIHHQQQQRLQPATGRGQYELPLHWPAKRRPLRKKKAAQSQSEKPQTKAKVVMPRNGLNVQPVGRQCRRPDRPGHGQWQGTGAAISKQRSRAHSQLAQGSARCVYAMHTLAYDN